MGGAAYRRGACLQASWGAPDEEGMTARKQKADYAALNDPPLGVLQPWFARALLRPAESV